MRFLRILVLTTSFPKFHGDLPGRFILDLLFEFEKRGHTAVVIAPSYRDAEQMEPIGGIQVVRAGSRLPGVLKLSSSPSLKTQFQDGAMGKLRVLTYAVLQLFHGVVAGHNKGIEIINSHWLLPSGLAGGFTSSILGKPHVVTTHGSGVAAAEMLPLGSLVTEFIARHCFAFTSVSQYLAARLSRLLARSPVPQNRIFWVPMGVDENSFRPNSVAMPERPSILFVGRLDGRKGVEYLLEAASILVGDFPEITIRIVGDGPLRADLEGKAHQLGVYEHVHFLGVRPNSELPKEYANCQIVVVPSTNNGGSIGEGLGLVAVEGAMSGRPVVASNVGGIPEVIQDQWSGILVPAGDSPGIASAIRLLMNDRGKRIRFSKRGRIHSLEFSQGRAADRLESIFGAAGEGRDL